MALASGPMALASGLVVLASGLVALASGLVALAFGLVALAFGLVALAFGLVVMALGTSTLAFGLAALAFGTSGQSARAPVGSVRGGRSALSSRCFVSAQGGPALARLRSGDSFTRWETRRFALDLGQSGSFLRIFVFFALAKAEANL